MKKKKSKKLSKNTTKKISHKIILKVAKKDDFIEIDKYVIKNGKKVKKWKMIEGHPYWLINKDGNIENQNYILTKNTDLAMFSIYLKKKQVLILKKHYE